MRRALALAVVLGCHHPSAPVPAPDGAEAEPALVDVAFVEDPAEAISPERGFYNGIDLLSTDDFTSIRAGGMTLAIALVHLDAYRATPLDQPLLDQLTAGLARVRAAGIEVILRFNYNDGPVGAPDAPLDVIHTHIAQLAPIIAANADVIAFVQAGFIGAWGEWHDSTNGLDTTVNHLDVLQTLAAAVPVDRAIQIRTPEFVDAMFPGGPLQDGFNGTLRARLGYHDDCFLASPSDYGTYADPIETWKDYVAADTRFTPMGGETCAVDLPRSDCASALAEMTQLHVTYVNSAYQPDVLAGWTAQGCMPEIHARLGYRLVLESARYSQTVKPGGRLQLELALRNDGFAAPMNPRALQIVLDSATDRRVATLTDIDVRRWGPGDQQVTATLHVPSDLAPGTYRLSAWLPAPALETRPEFAIVFANTGVMDASGLAVLVPALVVDPSAPGEVEAGTDFIEL